METIAYIAFGFALSQLFVALTNLIFLQAFPKNNLSYKPLVSVLIPARNEEENIGNILSDLLKQAYKNIEIIVFNDDSSDNTAKITTQLMQKDARIKLINSSNLPNGWLGKNYGCHALSEAARGAYFLFIDADVRIRGNSIAEALTFMQNHKLGLLSVFPKQIMKSWGEYITVPNMNYILLSLLPLILVRKTKFPSMAAANGQFMLFKSEVYKNTKPHEKLRKSKVEDIEIARFFKKSGIKIACLTGKRNIECRMYNNFSSAFKGFSKNIIVFFGNSVILAILFWVLSTLGFIFVAIGLSSNLLLIYTAIWLLTRIFVSLASRQNVFKNLLLSLAQQFSMGFFIYKALFYTSKNAFTWKERNIA